MKRTLRIDRLLMALGIVALLMTLLIRIGMGIKRLMDHPPRTPSVTLRFVQWWEPDMEPGSLKQLITEFEEHNPDITVHLETRSYREIAALALNGFPPGDAPPDLIALDPRWLHDLIENGSLEDLLPYLATSSLDLSISPERSDTRQYLWEIPLVTCIAPLFYNINLLKQAGFDRPPKTTADVLEYARKITRPEAEQYGMAFALSPEYPLGVYIDVYPWLWAGGFRFVVDGAPQFYGAGRSKDRLVRRANNTLIEETLTFLKTLVTEELIAPGPFVTTPEEKLDRFAAGSIAMMIAPVDAIGQLTARGMEQNQFGITAIPPPESYRGKAAFGLTSWYAGMLRQSTHQDEAWLFLVFLAEHATVIAQAAHAVPGVVGSGLGNWSAKDSLYAKAFDLANGSEALQEWNGIPKAAKLDSVVREGLYYYFGSYPPQNPEDAASQIQSRWDTVLGRASPAE